VPAITQHSSFCVQQLDYPDFKPSRELEPRRYEQSHIYTLKSCKRSWVNCRKSSFVGHLHFVIESSQASFL